jgi:hypothetical protein
VQQFKPQLTAPLPEGWFAKGSLTLLAPDGMANVIASSEPIDASIDTTQYAQVQGDLLRREFPGYHEFAFAPAKMLGERQGYIRRFEWTPPDGDPVTQIQLYCVENGRGYTATATTPTTQFERYEMQFRKLLGKLMINDGGGVIDVGGGGDDGNRIFVPEIVAELPEGWFVKEQNTLLSSDGEANVIASSEPLDASIDTTQYAQVQGELLRSEFPGYREFSFGPAKMLGERQGYIRRFEWTPPGGAPVTQIQLYSTESGRGFTATATTLTTQFERFEMLFRQVLGGLKLNQG